MGPQPNNGQWVLSPSMSHHCIELLKNLLKVVDLLCTVVNKFIVFSHAVTFVVSNSCD